MASIARGLEPGKTGVTGDASRAFFERGAGAVQTFPGFPDQKPGRQIAQRDQTSSSPLQDWGWARRRRAITREVFLYKSECDSDNPRTSAFITRRRGHFIMYMGRWVVGLIGLGVGVAVGRSSKDSPTTRKMLRGAVRHTLSIGRSVQRAVHEAQEELSDIAAEAEAEEALATASKKASVSRKD